MGRANCGRIMTSMQLATRHSTIECLAADRTTQLVSYVCTTKLKSGASNMIAKACPFTTMPCSVPINIVRILSITQDDPFGILPRLVCGIFSMVALTSDKYLHEAS